MVECAGAHCQDPPTVCSGQAGELNGHVMGTTALPPILSLSRASFQAVSPSNYSLGQ